MIKSTQVQQKYDVVIIGAGVAGLACGCYLAKAGLKILIAEHHYVVGGCCSSFKRGRHTFDVGVHFLGSLREGGIIDTFLKEFDLRDKLELSRTDPSDFVMLPQHRIPLWNEPEKIQKELSQLFPQEKRVGEFIQFVITTDLKTLFRTLYGQTFKDVLDSFFLREELKAFFKSFLGNFGLASDNISGYSACVLFREYVFDTGYYPKGSTQAFSNLLADTVEDYGGHILLQGEVTKILIQGSSACGVEVNGNLSVKSDLVISCCDAILTYFFLVGKDKLPLNFITRLESLKRSITGLVIYLGLNKQIGEQLPYKASTWIFDTYDIDGIYNRIATGDYQYQSDHAICAFPSFYDRSLAPEGKETMYIIIGAQWKDKEYWKEHKDQIADAAIRYVEQRLIPGLSDLVYIREVGSPQTIFRYTKSYQGALYGWASTPDQSRRSVVPQKTPIANLYMAGQWATLESGQSGVSTAVYSARMVTKVILSHTTTSRVITQVSAPMS